MAKRPLLLFWIGLMLAIWLCRAAGIPIFGEPVLSPEEEGMLETGITAQVTGTVRSRQIRERSIQYILHDVTIRHKGRNMHVSNILLAASGQAAVNRSSQGSLKESASSYKSEYGITERDAYLPEGAVVRLWANCSFIMQAGNPGEFDRRQYYACRKIWVQAFAETGTAAEILHQGPRISEHLCRKREFLMERLSRCVSPASAGVLGAMLLGDRSMMDEETRTGLQNVSLYHIISISGMHIMLLGMNLYRLLMYLLFIAGGPSAERRKKIRMSAAAGCASAAVMTGFCLWIGSPVSAVRAVIMFAVALGARILRRSYDTLSALSLAGILILAENPGYLFYAGFQLSAAAVLSVAVIYPQLMRLLPESFWRKGSREKQLLERILRAAALWASVTAGMLPLTAWYFYKLPLLGLPANLMAVPFLGPVMVWGFLGLAAGGLSVTAGHLFLLPADLGIRALTGLAGLAGRQPGSVWVCGKPSLTQTFLYYGLLASALLILEASGRKEGMERIAGRMRICALMIFAVSVPALFYRVPDKCAVTMLDVGQGDGLVLSFSSGHPFAQEKVFLCDGGSSDVQNVGRYRLLPYLEYRGIREVEAVFVSHADEDHISGLEEILHMMAEGQSSVRIRKLLLPVWMERDPAAESLRLAAREAEVPAVYLSAGDSVKISISGSGEETAEIRILHPFPQGGAREGNAGSLVFRLDCGSFRALFTGDLEGAGEEEILPFLSDTDCLKVAHHGSGNSTLQVFLEQTDPRIALISCGRNNRYGHPHRELLQRLSDCGSDIYRTDRAGAVKITVDPGRDRCYPETFRDGSV